MATTTHYIRFYYDADDEREGLLQQTGQLPDSNLSQENETEVDPWQTESSSFGPSRLTASAPAFVPAALSYEEVNEAMENGFPNPHKKSGVVRGKKSEISAWYKSLNRQSASALATPQLHSPSGSASPAPLCTASSSSKSADSKRSNHCRKDWFISNVLRQSSSSTPSLTPTSTPPPSTLADILARDPPTDTSHVPPVWIQIGPSNLGYAMLQKSGWNEGEGLGSSVVRRNDPVSSTSRTGKKREAKSEEDDESIIEAPLNADVIDLTLSDSDAEDGFNAISPSPSITERPVLDHGGKALLTPLPTTLKSDRLGIGLKAKKNGPYRSSQKRVTHNAAAMAAHIQASEDMRKIKSKVGRGSRGFAKLKKRESAKRRNFLAYLNS